MTEETREYQIRAFGKLMRSARKRHGLSQKELAKRAGISLLTVSKYERGKVKPYLGAALSIASVLHMDLNVLRIRELKH